MTVLTYLVTAAVIALLFLYLLPVPVRFEVDLCRGYMWNKIILVSSRIAESHFAESSFAEFHFAKSHFADGKIYLFNGVFF